MRIVPGIHPKKINVNLVEASSKVKLHNLLKVDEQIYLKIVKRRIYLSMKMHIFCSSDSEDERTNFLNTSEIVTVDNEIATGGTVYKTETRWIQR